MESIESLFIKRILVDRVDRVDTVTSEIPSSSRSEFALKVFRCQYLDERTADVHFICGPEQVKVPAHKSILAKASDAFDSMFYGPLAEKGDVSLPKTSPEAFKQFLQFVYLDNVEFDLYNIVGVMDLSKKYCMPECLNVCGRFWASHVTFEYLCLAYRWAIFYEEAELTEFCERKISAYTLRVFESSSFLCCDYTTLQRILKLDSLLCYETSVLGACLEWARHACERNDLDPSQVENLRWFLKDSLYQIRYGSMTTKEFCEHMDANNGLFTDVADYEDIIRLLSGSKELKTGRFNPNPRSLNIFVWNPNKIFKCVVQYSPSSVFVSNKPLLLGGLYCGPISDPTKCSQSEFTWTFSEHPPNQTDGKKSPKIILVKKLFLDLHEETYVDLWNNGVKPIIVKPAHKYRSDFTPKPTGCMYKDPSKPFITSHEMMLGDGLKIAFTRKDTIDDFSVIRRFLFNTL